MIQQIYESLTIPNVYYIY